MIATPDPEAMVIWLVEVDFGGRMIRLCDAMPDADALHVDSDAGPLHFHAVLDEFQVTESINAGDTTMDMPEASISCVWPLNVAARIAAGFPLTFAPAKVSRWVVGTSYEERRVVVVGRVCNPVYGAEGEPTSCTISGAPWLDRQLIPPAGQIVTGANFLTSITSLDTDQLGKLYPRVYGNPGKVDASVSSGGQVSGARGRRIDARADDDAGNNQQVRILVAGHHVAAQRAYLLTEDETAAERVFIRNGFDDAGQPIAFVPWFYVSSPIGAPQADTGTYSYSYSVTDFDSATTYALGSGSLASSFNDTQSQAYLVWIDDEDDSRGGVTRDGVTVRSAGDVILDLLEQSTLPVDRTRMATAARLLRPFLLDFAIDARVTPWDFIVNQLLPLLPATPVPGPEGMALVVWRYDAKASDAVALLDTGADPSVSRASMVEEDSSMVANEFTLRYAKSVRTNTFVGVARLTAGEYDADAPDVVPDALCALSAKRFGLSEKTLDAPVVYDRTTAFLILNWWAKAFALPRVAVEYDVDEVTYWKVGVGDVVLVTDPEIALQRRVALVREVTLGSAPGTTRLRLQLLPPETLR